MVCSPTRDIGVSETVTTGGLTASAGTIPNRDSLYLAIFISTFGHHLIWVKAVFLTTKVGIRVI